MNDLEKLKSTFTDIGIEFVTEDVKHEAYNVRIVINEGIGYSGFLADFYFLDGKFVNHGVWE